MDIVCEKVEDRKGDICDEILRVLPEWFGIESAIVQYVKDVEKMDMYIAKSNDQIIGFISINKHNKYTAEIHVMGIMKEFHKKGIGKRLIELVEKELENNGFEFFIVKTLSPLQENEEYKRTRLFYESMGFRPLEEFKTLWGEANPCLLMGKYISGSSVR